MKFKNLLFVLFFLSFVLPLLAAEVLEPILKVAYDEKMAADLGAFSIQRLGVPGDYHYEVLGEQERDHLLPFVSKNEVDCYCYYLHEDAAILSKLPFLGSDLSVDPALKSNILFFKLLADERRMQECNTDQPLGYWDTITDLKNISFFFGSVLISGCWWHGRNKMLDLQARAVRLNLFKTMRKLHQERDALFSEVAHLERTYLFPSQDALEAGGKANSEGVLVMPSLFENIHKTFSQNIRSALNHALIAESSCLEESFHSFTERDDQEFVVIDRDPSTTLPIHTQHDHSVEKKYGALMQGLKILEQQKELLRVCKKEQLTFVLTSGDIKTISDQISEAKNQWSLSNQAHIPHLGEVTNLVHQDYERVHAGVVDEKINAGIPNSIISIPNDLEKYFSDCCWLNHLAEENTWLGTDLILLLTADHGGGSVKQEKFSDHLNSVFNSARKHFTRATEAVERMSSIISRANYQHGGIVLKNIENWKARSAFLEQESLAELAKEIKNAVLINTSLKDAQAKAALWLEEGSLLFSSKRDPFLEAMKKVFSLAPPAF